MFQLESRVKALVPARYHPALRSVYWKLRPSVYLRARALRYAGTRVQCPICGGRFRGFVPFRVSGGARFNAMCPACDSLERHRLLWLYLVRETPLLSEPSRLLHFAPEYSMQRSLRRLPNVRYTSADLDSPLASEKTDMTDLRYPDASFDLILCSHVLEHIVDDRKAMRELHRVLAPAGRAVVQVPVDTLRDTTFEDAAITLPEERERAFGQYDHVRLYGRDVKERLESAGLIVENCDYAAQFDPAIVAYYGITKGDRINAENLYVCTRR